MILTLAALALAATPVHVTDVCELEDGSSNVAACVTDDGVVNFGTGNAQWIVTGSNDMATIVPVGNVVLVTQPDEDVKLLPIQK